MAALFCLSLILFPHLLLCVSSFIQPKPLLKKCSHCPSRSEQLKLRLGRGFESEAAVAEATVLENGNLIRAKAPRMVPISQPPLLLLQSSNPIISEEGCALLSEYFEHLTNDKTQSAWIYQLDRNRVEAAEELLRDVHDVIDRVTNCPRHDGEMQIPRYVRYDATIINERQLLQDDPKNFGDNHLLPDGLHVDTNNGKLFRHITAILYLTDNQDGFGIDENVGTGGPIGSDTFVAGGGTTFPLATPLQEGRFSECNQLQKAAESLLERGIQHTKGDMNESAHSDGRVVEKAALDIFYSHVKKDLCVLNERHGHCSSETKPNVGVRVMPKAGKLIYFHNVDDDGQPDPLTFHGGEELIAVLPDQYGYNIGSSQLVLKNKSILVFFKEIPIETFRARGQKGFAEQVEKARSWTKEMYYPLTPQL